MSGTGASWTTQAGEEMSAVASQPAEADIRVPAQFRPSAKNERRAGSGERQSDPEWRIVGLPGASSWLNEFLLPCPGN